MASIMTKRGSQDNVVTYEYICDSTSDMASIEDKYATLGSTCIVLKGESGGMEVYIADSDKQWNSFSSIGGGTAGGNTADLAIHICTQNEVSNGLPDVELPDETTIYLVPASDASSSNLYDEYIYVDDEWEKFGSANIDLTGYYQKPVNGIPASDLASGVIPDVSIYAPIASPVFTGSISLGRKDNTTAGTASFAVGVRAEASGAQSHAEGVGTTASGDQSHAEGVSTVASGLISHAAGASTIASGAYQCVCGMFNVEDSYANWPEWTASTSYAVGDKVKVTTTSGNNTTITGYICKTTNNDSSFVSSKWIGQGGKINYIEIVGNGEKESARSNARALDWDGNEHLMGDIYVGCNADSTGGTKVVTEAVLASLINRIAVLESKVAYLEGQHVPDAAVTDETGAQITDESSNFITYNN